MVHRYVIDGKAITEAGDRQAQVLAYLAPDEREKTALAEALRLDDYDLASAFDPDEVARLEVTGERAFILWKAPQRAVVAEAIELGVNSVALVLNGQQLAFVMSASELPIGAREFRNPEDIRDVLLGFLLQSVRHYVGHLRVIKQLSTDLETKITVSMENRHLLQMFALGESLVYYLDAIEANSAVLTKLRTLAGLLGLSLRQQQLLDDIILENQQAARQANVYSSVLSGLMDARGTIVNNNMGVLLKNLTLINVVFLPLNLIASIGGMSEYSMMTRGISWPLAYALFAIGMVAFGWFTWMVVTRIVGLRGQHDLRIRRRLST
ncbi:MAG: magnesium transporter CorA family protein, partial [Gemmatimonadetes bacterium]|nr:magnesium transporter CorA family protein [Gemmatimonadota bacterium]